MRHTTKGLRGLRGRRGHEHEHEAGVSRNNLGIMDYGWGAQMRSDKMGVPEMGMRMRKKNKKHADKENAAKTMRKKKKATLKKKERFAT